MSKSTTIVTSTTALSAIADTLSRAAASGEDLSSKQKVLNTFARGIAGPRHDWGYLTGRDTPIVQSGLPEARLADLARLQASPRPAPRRIPSGTTGPVLTIRPHYERLYSPERAAYLRARLGGDILAITEQFSTAGEFDTPVQCMFEPDALLARPDGLDRQPLWSSPVELASWAGATYFAASGEAGVNDCVTSTILSWSVDAFAETFLAIYLPHAVAIVDEDTLRATVTTGGGRADAAAQVFIDASLNAAGRAAAAAEIGHVLGLMIGQDGTGATVSIA